MSKPKKTAAKAPNKPVQHLVVVPERMLQERRQDSDSLISALARAAADPKMDVDKIERLWAIQKEATAMRAEQEFSSAKNAVAKNIPPIPKNHLIKFVDKKGNTQETPYADRHDIEKAIGPIYLAAGFSTEYTTDYVDSKIQTVLILRHNSGHKEFYKAPPMPLDTSGSKNNNQAAGSTSEYGMRYCLKGAFNIIGVDKDDDGNLGEPTAGHKGDKFGARVAEQSGTADVVDVAPQAEEHINDTIKRAAETLIEKIKSAETPERRGQVLMRNVKLLKEMEIQGWVEAVKTIRALAEGDNA